MMGPREKRMRYAAALAGRLPTDEEIARVQALDSWPPLFLEMIDLARYGEAYLPATPDQPSTHIAIKEVEWTEEHRCFIGGPEFKIIRIPAEQHVTVVPRRYEPTYFLTPDTELPSAEDLAAEDMYYEQVFGVAFHGRRRWAARYMVHPSYTLPREHRI